MKNRELVRVQYPNAWSINSAQAKEWVIMKGTAPDGRIGHGATALAAWKSAASAVKFARGAAETIRERHG